MKIIDLSGGSNKIPYIPSILECPQIDNPPESLHK